MARRVPSMSHFRPRVVTWAGPAAHGEDGRQSVRRAPPLAIASIAPTRTEGHQPAGGLLRRRPAPQAVRAWQQQGGGGVHPQQGDVNPREGVEQAQRRQLVVQPPAQCADSHQAEGRHKSALGGGGQGQLHAFVQVRRVLWMGERQCGVQRGDSKLS